MMTVQHNTVGGRDPCGGHVGGGGKREGMAGRQTRSNNPGGCNKPVDKVRQLQRRLWTAAKRSPDRRFHALYDRIFRRDVLEEAWRRVRRNKGAAGVDEQTLAGLEQYGVEPEIMTMAKGIANGFPLAACVRGLERVLPDREARAETSLPAGPVNALFSALLGAEAPLVRGAGLPFGLTLISLATKRGDAGS